MAAIGPRFGDFGISLGPEDVTPEALHASAPPADAPAAEARRSQGRTVTSFDGVRLRGDAWAVAKRAHVDRIHAFIARHSGQASPAATRS